MVIKKIGKITKALELNKNVFNQYKINAIHRLVIELKNNKHGLTIEEVLRLDKKKGCPEGLMFTSLCWLQMQGFIDSNGQVYKLVKGVDI